MHKNMDEDCMQNDCFSNLYIRKGTQQFLINMFRSATGKSQNVKQKKKKEYETKVNSNIKHVC